MSLFLQVAHCWHEQVVLNYLLWCMCLGLVKKGGGQCSGPGSWLHYFGQDFCGSLANNMYIYNNLWAFVFFFFHKTTPQQQKDELLHSI